MWAYQRREEKRLLGCADPTTTTVVGTLNGPLVLRITRAFKSEGSIVACCQRLWLPGSISSDSGNMQVALKADVLFAVFPLERYTGLGLHTKSVVAIYPPYQEICFPVSTCQ
jgi:hypothetical protein